ncbi:MAG: recombination protein RecR [Phycisphaerales bacterium]|nr:MAG: recombination protein RecR [Phycisphaerales bacterium]
MNGESIDSLARLREQFQKLPGIGPRSAERLAFHVLREPREFAAGLAQAILDVKDKIIHCRTCYNLTETDPCRICADPARDKGEIWVVEQPKDLMALEATGLIRGTYHVLMGHIAPLEGIEPEDLTIDGLIERVRAGSVRELVLALNPTMDGDGTALHLQSLLSEFDVSVTRPARGLAVGSHLEYATVGMLEAAIRARTRM